MNHYLINKRKIHKKLIVKYISVFYNCVINYLTYFKRYALPWLTSWEYSFTYSSS